MGKDDDKKKVIAALGGYTSDSDLALQYLDGAPHTKFVDSVIRNIVYVSATADKDASGSVSATEARAVLNETHPDPQEYCEKFADAGHLARLKAMTTDIKHSAGKVDAVASARIGAELEATLKEKMPALAWATIGPNEGELNAPVQQALLNPAVVAASKHMVLENDPGFDPLTLCANMPQKAKTPTRERNK